MPSHCHIELLFLQMMSAYHLFPSQRHSTFERSLLCNYRVSWRSSSALSRDQDTDDQAARQTAEAAQGFSASFSWAWAQLSSSNLEKEIATHSSIFAWRIRWTEEPGRLQSIGLHRVGHNRSNLAQFGTCRWVRNPKFKKSKNVECQGNSLLMDSKPGCLNSLNRMLRKPAEG